VNFANQNYLGLFVVAANFGLENLASLSLAVNLIMYFMLIMHINLADASNLLTNYMGTSYMIAVLITAFADTFVGRYQTVIISSMVEIIVRTLHLIFGCYFSPTACFASHV
jgi:peptide/histidine transporter 3/4